MMVGLDPAIQIVSQALKQIGHMILSRSLSQAKASNTWQQTAQRKSYIGNALPSSLGVGALQLTSAIALVHGHAIRLGRGACRRLWLPRRGGRLRRRRHLNLL